MKYSGSDIAQYYDVTRDHYSLFWKLTQHRSLHYGYWDHSTKNISEALTKINAVMAQKAGITNGMKILDAGCGEGGSVAWLSKQFDVTVTGITLSYKQMKAGNDYLQQQKLNSAHIKVQDYTKTNFPDKHFDVIWSIESVCHASDKTDYLMEMHRVLKPGGVIIIADFFLAKELAKEEQRLIDKWANAWAVESFEQATSFITKATAAGFTKCVAEDITQNIRNSVNRLYRSFYMGLPLSLLYNLFHPRTTRAAKQNVYSAYWQYITFKRKLWNYQLVLLRK